MEYEIKKQLQMMGTSHILFTVVFPNDYVGSSTCKEMVETLKDLNSMVLCFVEELRLSLDKFGYKWVEFYECGKGELNLLINITDNGELRFSVGGDLHACYSANILTKVCAIAGVEFVESKDN